MSRFAEKRFMEIQARTHRKYGHNLHTLKSPRYWAQNAPKILKQDDPMTDGEGTDLINGVEINLEDARSLLLGIVGGMQLNDNTFGACFYTQLDMIDFTEYMSADWQKLKASPFDSWYNFLVYDMVHLNGNLVASYE